MVARADEAHPLEIGASLLGYYSDDQHTAHVDGVCPTPEDAEGSRYGFRRGLKGLATLLERIFIKSKGKRYYVGEFHSHPSGPAVPSAVDDRAQFSIAKDIAAQCATPVLLIVGGDPGARDIGVSVYTRSGQKWMLARHEIVGH
jgi:proteasome lid subunit RPN8/RPN11